MVLRVAAPSSRPRWSQRRHPPLQFAYRAFSSSTRSASSGLPGQPKDSNVSTSLPRREEQHPQIALAMPQFLGLRTLETVEYPPLGPMTIRPVAFNSSESLDVYNNETIPFNPHAVHDIAKLRINIVDALYGMPTGTCRFLPVFHRNAGDLQRQCRQCAVAFDDFLWAAHRHLPSRRKRTHWGRRIF